MTVEKRYWDSDVIISFLQKFHGRVETCKAIFEMAERGEIKIIVSALSIVEVLKLGKYQKIPKGDKEKVLNFFQSSYIRVIDVNFFRARDSQELVWEKGIDPKDSLHVATALWAKVDVFETYDRKLINKSKTIGEPPLEIREPSKVQMHLPFEAKEKEEFNEEEPISEDSKEEE